MCRCSCFCWFCCVFSVIHFVGFYVQCAVCVYCMYLVVLLSFKTKKMCLCTFLSAEIQWSIGNLDPIYWKKTRISKIFERCSLLSNKYSLLTRFALMFFAFRIHSRSDIGILPNVVKFFANLSVIFWFIWNKIENYTALTEVQLCSNLWGITIHYSIAFNIEYLFTYHYISLVCARPFMLFESTTWITQEKCCENCTRNMNKEKSTKRMECTLLYVIPPKNESHKAREGEGEKQTKTNSHTHTHS